MTWRVGDGRQICPTGCCVQALLFALPKRAPKQRAMVVALLCRGWRRKIGANIKEAKTIPQIPFFCQMTSFTTHNTPRDGVRGDKVRACGTLQMAALTNPTACSLQPRIDYVFNLLPKKASLAGRGATCPWPQEALSEKFSTSNFRVPRTKKGDTHFAAITRPLCQRQNTLSQNSAETSTRHPTSAMIPPSDRLDSRLTR